MFAIWDQVKIIGELYISGNLLQDVYTKALAALLDIGAVRDITAAYTGRDLETQLILRKVEESSI